MRIPLTKYGLPQVAVFPLLLVGAMVLYWLAARYFLPAGIRGSAWKSFWVIWLPELMLLATLIWALSFFRDPVRRVPNDPAILISPADGTVTDIEIVDQYPGFPGKVQKIGIFLSVFNVHINRMPCAARVEQITYKPGAFGNAMDPKSGKVNEANELMLARLDAPADPVMVRQISGAIARRIVCEAREGETYSRGQQFGMIKFGSRTELIYPARDNAQCLAKLGDKVKAGETILVRYE